MFRNYKKTCQIALNSNHLFKFVFKFPCLNNGAIKEDFTRMSNKRYQGPLPKSPYNKLIRYIILIAKQKNIYISTQPQLPRGKIVLARNAFPSAFCIHYIAGRNIRDNQNQLVTSLPINNRHKEIVSHSCHRE